MKRKVWNKANVPQTKSTGSWIRIHPKSGGITFSNDLATALKLSSNGVNFIQDEERPGDWYIEVSKDKDAFEVRSKKANEHDKAFIIQSTALARTILSSIGIDMVSTRFMVATEAIERNTYAIITKSAVSARPKLKAA
jgi:hypothetical protein